MVRALNDIHPQNQGKAKFFMLFGFMLANWQELRKALLDHPHNNAVVNQTTFQYGEIYEIGCSIASPDGRNPCVRSFWAIEPPSTDPKFITAYAAPQGCHLGNSGCPWARGVGLRVLANPDADHANKDGASSRFILAPWTASHRKAKRYYHNSDFKHPCQML